MSKFAKPLPLGVVLVVAVIGVALTHFSFAAVNPSVLEQNKQALQQAVSLASYQDGMWMPAKYTTDQWEKYQHGALAMAALGTQPDGTAAQRQVAIDTVNKAIDTHQLPSGEFDNGTPASGNSGVNGAFWVISEGVLALTLKDYVSTATLQKWEQSMVNYSQYLKTSTNSTFYANGNVVLMQTAVMLQTYKLATLVGDPNAQSYWNDYVAERTFLVNPVSPTDTRTPPAWSTYGQRTNSSGGLWFTETNFTSERFIDISCRNGKVPCDGYDPNYITAQLQDAITAYVTGEDSQFWLNIIKGEYTAIASLISNGNINASNGSRKDIPSEVFFASPYSILEQNNLGNYDQAWSEQISAFRAQFATYANGHDPGPNVYSLMLGASIPVILGNTGGTSPKIGDLNHDGVVDRDDINQLTASYAKTDTSSDLDGKSPVNIYDLSILMSHYGK